MKLAIALTSLTILAIPSRTVGQTTEPDQTAPAPSPVPQSPSTVDRQVSLKLLLPNLISDQKRIWSFPVTLAHGQNWIPTTAVLGTIAALVALDPTEATYFRRTSTFHGFNNILTGNATSIRIIAAPVALYGFGLIRKDTKMEHTGLLVGETVANAEILTTVLKDVTNRIRPAGFPAQGNLYDSWFDTVIARRYGNHRWVPYAAYGTAALISFSRLSLSAHFLSDVFMGGAPGYSISRFTVLRQ